MLKFFLDLFFGNGAASNHDTWSGGGTETERQRSYDRRALNDAEHARQVNEQMAAEQRAIDAANRERFGKYF
jgi:hypothetical protein